MSIIARDSGSVSKLSISVGRKLVKMSKAASSGSDNKAANVDNTNLQLQSLIVSFPVVELFP